MVFVLKIKSLLRQSLAFLILLQSCQVYHKTSFSLEDASRAKLPVKVITKTEEKSVYRKIILENQEYFGLDKKNGNLVKYPLENENIEKILIKNKNGSTWLTIGVILIPTLIIGFLVGVNETEKSIENIFL